MVMTKGMNIFNLDISIITHMGTMVGLSPTPTGKVTTVLTGRRNEVLDIIEAVEFDSGDTLVTKMIRESYTQGVKQMSHANMPSTYEFSYECNNEHFKLSMHRFFTPLHGKN